MTRVISINFALLLWSMCHNNNSSSIKHLHHLLRIICHIFPAHPMDTQCIQLVRLYLIHTHHLHHLWRHQDIIILILRPIPLAQHQCTPQDRIQPLQAPNGGIILDNHRRDRDHTPQLLRGIISTMVLRHRHLCMTLHHNP